MKVTAKNINSLPEGMHRVDRGLYVRQREGKRPTFYFVYTILGKRKELSIGPVSGITITQARAKAAEYHHLLETGVDPQAAKKEKLRSMRDAGSVDKAAYTFADLLREALPTIEKAKRWRNAKHRAQWQSTLETYALPVLGPKPVEDVTRDDVLAVLGPIWDSKSETASRLRGRLEAVFSYAIASQRTRRRGGETSTSFCRHLLVSRRSSTMRRSPLMRLGRSSRTGTRPSRSVRARLSSAS